MYLLNFPGSKHKGDIQTVLVLRLVCTFVVRMQKISFSRHKGQVWYLIVPIPDLCVPIPDLCPLSYLYNSAEYSNSTNLSELLPY